MSHDTQKQPSSPSNGAPISTTEDRQVSVAVTGEDELNKPLRLPRWSRQEILVLIQGKKMAEGRVRQGRRHGSTPGSTHVEPKWASVSSYCKLHGVDRGPVQCRKRWCNLSGDYRKIKEWESKIKFESESFWVMRSDVRREKKLPGFFDKEVYDILDGAEIMAEKKKNIEEVEDEENSGEQQQIAEAPKIHGFLLESKKSTPTDTQEGFTASHLLSPGKEKQSTDPLDTEFVAQGQKRRRETSPDEERSSSTQEKLIEVLQRNSGILSTHLQAQNVSYQLDREQRKELDDSLVRVLGKIADSLGRIADKL